MIEKIVKITPLAGAILVFCGVLKLIFYYSHFDIQIIDYLEFQEIITSFLGDINIIIIFIMTMTLISFATLNLLRRKTKLQLDYIFEQMLIFIYPRRFKYSIFFVILSLLLLGLMQFEFVQYNYFLIYLITFSTAQTLTYLFLTKDDDEKVEISNFYGLVVIGVSLSVSIFLFAEKDLQKIKLNQHETKISTADETIICNRETKNLYIGKTNKYVFLRINRTKSTLVIPNDKIIKYEFK